MGEETEWERHIYSNMQTHEGSNGHKAISRIRSLLSICTLCTQHAQHNIPFIHIFIFIYILLYTILNWIQLNDGMVEMYGKWMPHCAPIRVCAKRHHTNTRQRRLMPHLARSIANCFSFWRFSVWLAAISNLMNRRMYRILSAAVCTYRRYAPLGRRATVLRIVQTCIQFGYAQRTCLAVNNTYSKLTRIGNVWRILSSSCSQSPFLARSLARLFASIVFFHRSPVLYAQNINELKIER